MRCLQTETLPPCGSSPARPKDEFFSGEIIIRPGDFRDRVKCRYETRPLFLAAGESVDIVTLILMPILINQEEWLSPV